MAKSNIHSKSYKASQIRKRAKWEAMERARNTEMNRKLMAIAATGCDPYKCDNKPKPKPAAAAEPKPAAQVTIEGGDGDTGCVEMVMELGGAEPMPVLPGTTKGISLKGLKKFGSHSKTGGKKKGPKGRNTSRSRGTKALPAL